MPVTINGTNGVITPEVVLDNNTADGGQVVLSSSGFSNWNLDNFSGRLRAYYGSTEYLTLTNAGNLGVGTTSPGARLHVAASDSLNAGVAATIIRQGGSAGNNGLLVDVTNTVGQYIQDWRIGNSSVARLDNGGNLLVGTTSANARLTVVRSGAGNFPSYTQGTDRGIHVDVTATSGIAVYFTTSSGSVQAGLISVSTNTAAYTSGSDYRLKDNVRPLTNALDKVAALRPVAFEWKADGTSGESFIAHELAEVCPQAVVGEKDAVDADGKPVYQGIDTSFLVATLTAAIQELHAQHIELKAIVDQQATEIANLKGQA